jgi:ubiquinone/menaquinone biosynthesis C-methylase UbiE
MDKAEFDKFADEYNALHAQNIAISGETPEFFASYKIKDLATEYMARQCNAGRVPAVLDFGAGIGTSVPFVRKYLPQSKLTCVDVSTRSLEIGQRRFGSQATFVSFAGNTLPFPEATFDVAYAACVFHHIDHAEHVRLLGELHRVLVRGGMLAVFEHNPYNPLTVKTVNECIFDETARLIPARAMRRRVIEARFHSTRIRYRIFFPRVLRGLRPLERRMAWIPLGAQYYVLAIK